jgi:hypothetical protein
MILGHLGEGLPFWIHRLNEHAQFAAKRRGLKKTPAQYLRQNLVVTTSGNFFMPAFLCTLIAVPGDLAAWLISALGGGFSAMHSSMAQNATARIGQSGTDAARERDDVIAHRRVDSIGHDRD